MSQLEEGSWEAFKQFRLLLTARIRGPREPERAATRGHQLLKSYLTPVLHRAPVGVWVEKAVHRLEPAPGEEVRSALLGRGLTPEPSGAERAWCPLTV